MPKKIWTRVREGALEALSPTRCASCERPGALVCDECLERMVRIDPVFSCLRCGAPFGSLVCTECNEARLGQDRPAAPEGAAYRPAAPEGTAQNVPPPAPALLAAIDRTLAAAAFEGPPSRIIRAYKDGGERRLAPLIADLLLEAARRAEEEAPERYGGLLSEAEGIVFVPATAAAYRRRGFDHMEDVARALCAASGVPLADALAKRGQGDQRALGRQGRIAAAARLYEVVLPVEGRSLLLIDDVLTTGATVGAAAAALKARGAAHVDVLAFARVW